MLSEAHNEGVWNTYKNQLFKYSSYISKVLTKNFKETVLRKKKSDLIFEAKKILYHFLTKKTLLNL